ncbi:(d)CMP kinase [Rhizobium beringeri]
MTDKTFIVAIDGPAAAGKGTLSRRIADQYGFHHLDTGLTYRATAKALLDAGLPLDDEAVAEKIAKRLNSLDWIAIYFPNMRSAKPPLRLPSCRRCAGLWSRRNGGFRQKAPGTVLDGRDIGTVVCPDAPVKLYVTASPEVRARRRYDEILGKGVAADFDAIFEDVKRRDERDMGRADSPLKPAVDAHLLDTSEMSIEAAFQAAQSIIDAVLSRNA